MDDVRPPSAKDRVESEQRPDCSPRRRAGAELDGFDAAPVEQVAEVAAATAHRDRVAERLLRAGQIDGGMHVPVLARGVIQEVQDAHGPDLPGSLGG